MKLDTVYFEISAQFNLNQYVNLHMTKRRSRRWMRKDTPMKHDIKRKPFTTIFFPKELSSSTDKINSI